MQDQERNRATTHELENQKLQTLQKESYERISHAYRKAQADWSNAEKEYEDAIAHNDEEMRSLNATVTTLRAELQQSNYIRESANERCQQLEAEVNKLQDSITRLKDENEKASFEKSEKHRKELDEKHEALIEMQTKHYEAVGKIKILESSLNNEKQIRDEQQEHLEKLLRNSAADAIKTKDKHEALQVAYTHAQISWATEKGNLEGQINLLNNKIDMMTVTLADAKEGTNSAQQTSEEMRNRAEAWKKEQSRLKTELRELNKKYDSVSMDKMKVEDEVRIQKEDAVEKAGEINALQKNFENFKSSTALSIKNLEALVEKKELQLKECGEKYENKISEFAFKKSKLQSKLDIVEVEKLNVANAFDQFKIDTNNYKVNEKKEKSEFVASNNSLRFKLEKSEDALINCKKNLADATEELLELKTGSNTEITDLRHNIEGLTKDVHFLRSSNNELKIAKARLEEKHLLFTGQISKLEKERSSNKSLIEEREKEIDSLKHNFDQQHTQAKLEYDSLKRDFDKSVKELNDRRIEFSTKLAENDSKMQNIKHEGVVTQRDFENKIANLRQQLKERHST